MEKLLTAIAGARFTMMLNSIVVLLLISFCFCHLPDGKDKKFQEDKEHLKKHMTEDGVNMDYDKMSSGERDFFYFKMHDYDNSSTIDGLEILKAIMFEDYEHLDPTDRKPFTPEQFNTITTRVDTFLKDGDNNNDGYIDYPEYKIMMSSGKI